MKRNQGDRCGRVIEQMNKYLFVVYHKEYEEFLKQLRELGVVHIKETKDSHEIAEPRG